MILYDFRNKRLKNSVHVVHVLKKLNPVEISFRSTQNPPRNESEAFQRALQRTQAELADRSGVSLRSIQMYEQKNKNTTKESGKSRTPLLIDQI